MNSKILEPEVQFFLRENLLKTNKKFSLQKTNFEYITTSDLTQQLNGLRISKNKFPFLFNTPQIYYPPSINLEQASSQSTAAYKSGLFRGNLLIDLTAGMGIDAYFFSKSFKEVFALEKNSELYTISKHNYNQLNCNNLTYVNADFKDFLTVNNELKPDLIYLDPSRRDANGRKFLIQDLEPNLYEWMDILLKISSRVLVKLSPLTDLKYLINTFRQINEIHLVAVKNEMKELLILIKRNECLNPKIVTVNLETDEVDFVFRTDDEKEAVSDFSTALEFIYEPNSAIMKSGAFKLVGQRFGLKKLDFNSHLYTSDKLLKSFPGRIFEVTEKLNSFKKTIKAGSFHVISKNYPLTADEIRNKYQLKQSETETLIFTKSNQKKIVLRCKRVYD